MNSRQLRWILSGDKFTKLSFKGVYAIDEMKLIETVSYPSSFVFNLHPSYKPGSHWVAVYFDRNGVGEYFDLFARYPPTSFSTLTCKRMAIQSYASPRTLYYDGWTIFCVLYLSKESRTNVGSHFIALHRRRAFLSPPPPPRNCGWDCIGRSEESEI